MKNMILILLTIATAAVAKADFSADHLATVVKHANKLALQTVITKHNLRLIDMNIQLGKRSSNVAPFYEEFTDYRVTLKYNAGETLIQCDISISVKWDLFRKRDFDAVQLTMYQEGYQLIMTNQEPFCGTPDQ